MEEFEYRVQLDNYSGPLELLLYLIKKAEIDVFDVEVYQIVEQYILYLQEQHREDIDSIGDFLLLLSSLLEVKSKLVLPREKLDLASAMGNDPRSGLVGELLEFRRFKNLSFVLDNMWVFESLKFHHPPEELEGEIDMTAILDRVLADVTVWDLLNANQRLEREIGTPPGPIVYDHIPVEEIMVELKEKVKEEGELLLIDLMRENRENKSWIAGMFISTLELVRQGRIEVVQEEHFQDILLKEGPRLFAADDDDAPEDYESPIEIGGDFNEIGNEEKEEKD